MATARVWTDAETRKLRDLHAKGQSLHSIAEQMCRSKSTIRKHAEQLGLSWDRTARTAAAAEAHRSDARARRAALAVALLADAEKLRQRLWEECKIYNFGGKDNTYNERIVEEPPYRDKRDLVGAVQVAVATSLRLDEYDSGESATVSSLLGSLLGTLQTKHGAGDDA